MRYFTVKDAEALIPELEKISQALAGIVAKVQAKAGNIERLEAHASPSLPEIEIEKGQLHFLSNSVNACLQRILDLGAYPKGLDPVLVDFPHRLASKEVYLCWRLGEKHITHYHGLEEGFGGRKALAFGP
jgi:hypothetical protein